MQPERTLTAPDQFITGMTVDQNTGALFVDCSDEGSRVWAFDGSRCNARVTSGCAQAPTEIPVAGWPEDLASDANTGTVYVPNNTDGEVSLSVYAQGVPFP
jgi:hypothetical protein